MDTQSQRGVSRRDFVKTTAAGAAAMTALGTNYAYPAGSDRTRIALIGCGGRGTADAMNCLRSAPGVEIVAMGDLFQDRLDSSLQRMRQGKNKKGQEGTAPIEEEVDIAAQVKVKDDHCFVGWDAYEKVFALKDVDLVLLTTPPGFRPIHFKAAIEAGKHVFMEKPVAVDPVGVRSVIDTAALADQKKLSVVAGTQYRHEKAKIDTIARILDGAIGEIVGGQAYYLTGSLWLHPRQPEWSDMETQIRNWLYYTWLSGDFIVEQHIHTLDVMNWVMGAVPEKALSLGGRQVRVEPDYGNVFDHFATEFTYPNGVRVSTMCRQIAKCSTRNGVFVVGAKGAADVYKGVITGENPWKWEGQTKDPSIQEHADLIASIRA
ncbi:MAG: Gfo/Idh/MocA family oxidoreductase, partial [Candidatus Sumerlaeota bacterium]|nr:Gfo/Idh/MocA family oxidoreductase [Candidatus Sumerlaeota bacterium]